MSEATNANPTGLYETALGEKNRAYYVDKFQEFDQKGPGLKASWNWPAFFFVGTWALYRKMYGWFFMLWFITAVLSVFMTIQNVVLQLVLAAVVLVPWLAFAIFANSLYHSKIKARIASANKAHSDASLVSDRLRVKGGIHAWVPIVFGAIPIIGIVAAVAIPAFLGNPQEQVAVTQPEATSITPALPVAELELQATSQPKPINTDAPNQRQVSEAGKQAQAELEQANQLRAWNAEVEKLFKTAAADGLDYRENEALNKELNGLVRAFGQEATEQGMTDDGLKASKWALMQAHEVMKKRHGKPSAMATKKKPLSSNSSIQDLIDQGIRLEPEDAPVVQAAPLPQKLGPIDRWRYESCQTEAAQAPTQQGVNVGLRICREKFAQ